MLVRRLVFSLAAVQQVAPSLVSGWNFSTKFYCEQKSPKKRHALTLVFGETAWEWYIILLALNRVDPII